MAKTPELRRGQRLPDDQRAKIGAELLKRYESGRSVRQICAETGYSIGRVRRLLEDAGVTFRSRGGRNSR
jgi:DNA-directed RNA polymerase specialized sigma24 family protein